MVNMFGDSKMQFILIVLLALIVGVCSSGPWACINCNSSSSTSCPVGYYPNNGICCTCDDNPRLIGCSTSPPCTKCQLGYYLNNGSCNKCSSQCTNCSTFSSCTKCQSGYYLDNGSCSPCSCQCLECSTSSSCTACHYGHYLNNGSCRPCSSPCLECSTSSSCTACQSGYYLNNGSCNQCSCPCLECNTSSSCTTCKSGYYLNNGSCNQCSSPCLECSTSSSCTTCQYGYYLNKGFCSECPQKYYLSDGICIACGNYCDSCDNTTGICDKCVPGYYGNICQNTCNGLCNGSKCDAVSGKCIDGCRVGYYQLENKCAICPSNCSSCQNSSRCTECQAGNNLETLADGSVVCSRRNDTCSACIEANCSRLASPTTSDKAIIGDQACKENSLNATTAGIAVGTFFAGFIVGILVIYTIQVLLRTRQTATQAGHPLAGNSTVPEPTLLYVNTKNLDNTIESPSTYESHSDRPDERHYSTLVGAS